jgi:hypothetical protein
MGSCRRTVQARHAPDDAFAYLIGFDRRPERPVGVTGHRHALPGPQTVGTGLDRVRRTSAEPFGSPPRSPMVIPCRDAIASRTPTA